MAAFRYTPATFPYCGVISAPQPYSGILDSGKKRLAMLRNFVATSFVLLGSLPAALAVQPWQLLTFKKIDADPNKKYEVTAKNGPWMIMAATFNGETAEKEAHELVLDLRKNHRVNAYLHTKAFGQREREYGLGYKEDGSPKVMVPIKNAFARQERFTEYAVLVGDYPAIDDAEAQKTLKDLKTIEPVSLKKAESLSSVNMTKQIQRVAQGVTRNKAPLGRAFMAPNPLLPPEYFTQKNGVDKFVLDMNKEVEYSLLKCPGKYSVQIATFRGKAVIDQRKISDIEKQPAKLSSSLDKAADDAHRLCVALRTGKDSKGRPVGTPVMAFEFHDREQSIVTVGSFDNLGIRNADGSLLLDESIRKVMAQYSVDTTKVITDPRDPSKQGARGTMIDGLVLDVTPNVIEVPRKSIAADYVRQ